MGKKRRLNKGKNVLCCDACGYEEDVFGELEEIDGDIAWLLVQKGVPPLDVLLAVEWGLLYSRKRNSLVEPCLFVDEVEGVTAIVFQEYKWKGQS